MIGCNAQKGHGPFLVRRTNVVGAENRMRNYGQSTFRLIGAKHALVAAVVGYLCQ